MTLRVQLQKQAPLGETSGLLDSGILKAKIMCDSSGFLYQLAFSAYQTTRKLKYLKTTTSSFTHNSVGWHLGWTFFCWSSAMLS